MLSEKIEIQLGKLEGLVETGFAATLRRQDDLHEENKTRFVGLIEDVKSVELEVKRINGSVRRHDEAIANTWRELKRIEAARDKHLPDGDTQRVSLGQLKWYLTCLGAGAWGLWWVLHLLGKV